MIRGNKVATKSPASPMRVFDVQTDIHNRFDIEVVRGDGTVEQYEAKNIILNAMWTRIGTNRNWFAAISYGSGTGSLSAARTDLFTRINTKALVDANFTADQSHAADGYVSFRNNIVINAGEITGQTIREVGISYDTAANHLMTHALLKDMNGNTVSITVGALDVINIYATVFVRFTASGYAGGSLIIPVDLSMQSNYYLQFLGHVAGVQAGIGWTIHGIFSGFDAFVGMPVYAPNPGYSILPENKVGRIGRKTVEKSWDSVNKRIIIRCSLAAGASYRIGTLDLNPAGADHGWRGGCFANGYSNGYMVFGWEFPNSAKAYCTITGEAVGTGDGATRDFALAFGYILNDGSAVIKVNGVTIDPSNYTLTYGVPRTTDLTPHMRFISGNRAFACKNLGTTTNIVSGDWCIFENPFYSTAGIASFYAYAGCMVECSNDMVNWTTIKAGAVANGTVNVNATYQKYRYWRCSWTANHTAGANGDMGAVTGLIAEIPATQLHFNPGQAPAAGAAITADYRTACIAKDTNHVVDLEVTVTLGEYAG